MTSPDWSVITREVLLRSGWTPQRLAEVLGISWRSVYRWLEGRRPQGEGVRRELLAWHQRLASQPGQGEESHAPTDAE